MSEETLACPSPDEAPEDPNAVHSEEAMPSEGGGPSPLRPPSIPLPEGKMFPKCPTRASLTFDELIDAINDQPIESGVWPLITALEKERATGNLATLEAALDAQDAVKAQAELANWFQAAGPIVAQLKEGVGPNHQDPASLQHLLHVLVLGTKWGMLIPPEPESV